VIQQEFGGMPDPNVFEQSIEIFIVELVESFSCGTPKSHIGVEHERNVFTTQRGCSEKAKAITGIP
jgi:hypothetical protein